jgi:hypothetical protein
VSAQTAVKAHQSKSEGLIAEGWVSLYETALAGIESEHEKHDLQRDYMVDKLRSIIADVTDENSGQVAMMERHSREIVAEAKANIASTNEGRAAMLKDKYGKLRRVLESSHEQGDDALAKHQTFLSEHYRSKFDEKYGVMVAQSDALEVFEAMPRHVHEAMPRRAHRSLRSACACLARVSHVSACACLARVCLARVSHVSRMCLLVRVSHVSVSHVSRTCLARVSHVSRTCLARVSHVSRTCLARVSHVSRTCLARVSHVSRT